jgi:hypothetical protein
MEGWWVKDDHRNAMGKKGKMLGRLKPLGVLPEVKLIFPFDAFVGPIHKTLQTLSFRFAKKLDSGTYVRPIHDDK